MPFTPGWDLIGAGVPGLASGQTVAAMPIRGAYAEFVCLLLHRSAAVRPGQRALIHGAAGGVGTARPGGKVVGYGAITSIRGPGLSSTRPGRRQRFRGFARFAQRLPLAEARRAHELLGSGGVTGKLVLVSGRP